MNECDDLDLLLYAWLSEEDERQGELRFNGYFRVAFPELCRYVRSLGADTAGAEDIAQQSLLKFFTRVGIGRKEADHHVSSAVSGLQALKLGTLHARLVQAWCRQVQTFRDAAITFRIGCGAPGPDPTWKELRAEINERVDSLIRQGMHLGDEIKESVQGLDAADAEGTLAACIVYTRSLCNHLPALAIPSNGLLYTIAKRQFIDSVRGVRTHRRDPDLDAADVAGGALLEELDLDDGDGAVSLQASAAGADPMPEAAARDGRDNELEQRYAAFLTFLRAPLTRAEAAVSRAAVRGHAAPERARAESLRAKYDRLTAILVALRETPPPTEDQIAGRLGLTRNQVKYAIERVRSEFNYFFPGLAREARGRRKRPSSQ